jgi:UDP-2,4-diacetamido-2,4,6-trideoxy-beta-L-altropyranose hydrolase
MKRKLLIRVDANNTIGYGHYFRCLAIALVISDSWDITFAVSEPTRFLVDNIKLYKFKYILVGKYDYTDPDSKGYADEIQFDLEPFLEDDFHSVLVDGYFFGPKYFEKLASYSVRVIVISDSVNVPIKAHILINSSPQITSEAYAEFDVETLALGPAYSMLRPEFYTKRFRQRQKLDSKKLLISFGGADHFGLTERIVEMCIKSGRFEEINLILKIGEISDYLEEILRVNAHVIPHGNLSANEVINIMNNCNMAILPSSGILYESMACELPTIICWYALNQKPLHDYLVNEHDVPTLGFVKNGTSMEELLSCIESISEYNPKVYGEMKHEMQQAPQRYAQLFA